MIAANFSEFRSGLKYYLDKVEDHNETLIVKRKTGKGSVVISLDEYNSMMETIHLLSSKSNADRLKHQKLKRTERNNCEGRSR